MRINKFISILCTLWGVITAVNSSCPTEPYCVRGPYGPLYGHRFNDFGLYMSTACHNITRIEVWHDDIVHGLKITYGSSVSDLRGSDTGTHENHEIQAGQWITKVEGYIGSKAEGFSHRITGLSFIKSDGAMLGPYGGQGVEDEFEEFTAIGTHDNKAGLAWISGRSGGNLDQLYFSFNCDL